MASALAPEEGLEYLLYAPIFDARRTPFGLRCDPASHAFAVTRRRFVLSTDTHREGEEATVESIPFDRILAVEWGDSLLEGWVALHFADGGRTGVVSWTYRATTGRKHVSRALQAYRRLTTHPVPGSAGRGSAAAALAAYPATLRDEIEPLLLESERLLDLAQSHELWHRPRRRPWKCLAAAGLLLATDRGLLHAERAPRAHPSRLELGRRGHCFPWETFAGWVDRGELDGLRWLSLRLERAGAALEVPLAVAPATAARLRTLVPGGRGREGR
jgi:hypothetical protein